MAFPFCAQRVRAPLRGLCSVALYVGVYVSSIQFAAAQSIRDAVEAAWARSVSGRSAEARALDAREKQDAAARWLAAPPSLTLAQRTDRLNHREGVRENEIELALPIRPWGVRDADRAVAATESEATTARLAEAKWRLAGEVREALWAQQLALLDVAAARQRRDDAAVLADDVARRVAAGELARIDANRAASERDAAELVIAEATTRARQTADVFRLLTGLAPGVALPETLMSGAWQDDARTAHPVIAHLRESATVAQARTRQVAADRRDPLALTIGTVREREAFGAPERGSVRIGLSIPLATHARNAPRIAEANVARIEADAALDLAREQVETHVRAAEDALARITALLPIATRRAAAARDTASLIARSWQLGETDLPTRLRAEADRADAERVATRATLEHALAISRLNHAKGLLP